MSNRRRLSPLLVLLLIFGMTCLTIPASAGGPDPAGGWQWSLGATHSTGWNFQECNVEATSCGAASSTTIFEGFATTVIPTTTPNPTWGVGKVICSDGSKPLTGWFSSSGSQQFVFNVAKSACPDSFAGTAKFVMWKMVQSSTPTPTQVDATDPGNNGANDSSYEMVEYIRYGAAPVLPSSPPCGQALGDARAGWDGTNLSLSFQYTGDTGTATMGNPPYFHVYLSNKSTTVALIPLQDVAQNFPGYFYAIVKPFSGVTVSSGISLWLNVGIYGATGTCGVSVNVVDYQVSQGPSSQTHNDNNSDGSTNCGIGWNILTDLKCAVTWAFVPTAGIMNGWNTRINSIETHPPVNIVTTGVGLANDVYSSANCSFDPNTLGNCYQTTGENAGTFHSMNDTSGNLNIVGAAGQFVQTTTGGALVYAFERIGVWVLFLIWAIRRVSMSFGGRD